MKVKTIKENPLITLESSDYNGYGTWDVYPSDLRNADVGQGFTPMYGGGCGSRDDRWCRN